MAIIQAVIRTMKTSQDQLEVVIALRDSKQNGHGRKSKKENELYSKKYNEKTYYWCKGQNLWCETKHNATNCNLLKNMKASDDKDVENNTSSINSNAGSFAAQMERIL